ncbi:MAG TPA: hypothetical protein VMI11_04590 [Actinomycetes bacterium]|nr:hypothetical protein [Actinomycetes bacterium]
MSQHARPSGGRGGGWFIALAFVVLVAGAYLANTVDNAARPAVGLASLSAAALALLSARVERRTRARIEELNEAQRREAYRMRVELDEAHARAQRALQRAASAEAAVYALTAATEGLLAARQALIAASVHAGAAPTTPSVAPETQQPQLLRPTVPPFPEPAGPFAPAASLTPPSLEWPLADVPAPRREPSLDLPLVPAPVAPVTPLFVPVESPTQPSTGAASTATGNGTEPRSSELVDLTSTSTTHFARPA